MFQRDCESCQLVYIVACFYQSLPFTLSHGLVFKIIFKYILIHVFACLYYWITYITIFVLLQFTESLHIPRVVVLVWPFTTSQSSHMWILQFNMWFCNMIVFSDNSMMLFKEQLSLGTGILLLIVFPCVSGIPSSRYNALAIILIPRTNRCNHVACPYIWDMMYG